MTEATRIRDKSFAKGKAAGRAEGRAEGKAEVLLENLQALMETTTWTAEEALAALKVPKKQYPKYLSMLK